MSVVEPRQWALPYQEHGQGPREWEPTHTLSWTNSLHVRRPSTWGSEHTCAGRAGLGRTDDGARTPFHADAGRTCIDPKTRAIETPGSLAVHARGGTNPVQFDGSVRHVAGATFGRSDTHRFRYVDQSLTLKAGFGSHCDQRIKRSVSGGSFGKSERWRQSTDHPDEDRALPNMHMMNFSNARGASAATSSHGAFGLSGTSDDRARRKCTPLARRQAEKPGAKEKLKGGVKAVMAANRLGKLIGKKPEQEDTSLGARIRVLPTASSHEAGMTEEARLRAIARRQRAAESSTPLTRSTMFTYMGVAGGTEVHHSRGSTDATRPRVGCLGSPHLM